MNISLRLLRYVVAAADTGNVTEAARHLDVSQPSVSAAIAELESMLGITVFVRHHAKGVSLTSAGQRLVGDARLLLKHAEDFTRTAQSLGDSRQGEITIGCFYTLAARFMPFLLLEFAKRYPGIKVRLEEGNQDDVLTGLNSGHLELAMAYDYALPSNMAATALTELPPVVTLPENHRLAQAAKISLADLAAEPFILFDAPYSRDYFLNMFRTQNLEPNIVLKLTSFELIWGLVARGHGYTLHTIVPLTNTTYDGGRVVIKPLAGKHAPGKVVCITPKTHPIRPAVSIFADFLKEAFEHPNVFGKAAGMSS